jgi:hypothetical protein
MGAIGRSLTLSLATLLIFAAAVAIGLKLIPEPRTDIDYLVIGCIATLCSLASLFAVLIAVWLRSPELFFKRRRKGPTPGEDEGHTGNQE